MKFNVNVCCGQPAQRWPIGRPSCKRIQRGRRTRVNHTRRLEGIEEVGPAGQTVKGFCAGYARRPEWSQEGFRPRIPIGLLDDIPVLSAALASHKSVRPSSWDNMMLPSLLDTTIILFDYAMILDPFYKAQTRAMVTMRLNSVTHHIERLW